MANLKYTNNPDGNLATIGMGAADNLILKDDGSTEIPGLVLPEALKATSQQAQDMTADDVVLTPKKLGDTMNAHVLGMGQTWQDVTESRRSGITYTNTTGRPIEVAVSYSETSNFDAGHTFNVNGVPVGKSVITYGESNKTSFTSVIVPAGASYSVTEINGGLYLWAELR